MSAPPRPARRLGPITLLLGGWLVAAPPAAAEPARLAVVIEQDGAADAFLAEARLRTAAELGAAGHEVRRAPCAPGLDAGCAAGASAPLIGAVALVPAGDEVQLVCRAWRARDGQTARLERRVPLESARADAASLGLRAAELLRATLLLLDGGAAEATVAAPAVRPPAAPGWAVEAGGAWLQSVAGLGPAFAPGLGAGWSGRGGWGFRARAVGPAFGPARRTRAGTAHLRQELAAAVVERAWTVGRARLALEGGGGVYHLRAVGDDDVAPLQPLVNDLWTPFVAAGPSAVVALGRGFGVQALVQALWLRDAPLLRLGAVEAGGTGQPLLLVGLGVIWVGGALF